MVERAASGLGAGHLDDDVGVGHDLQGAGRRIFAGHPTLTKETAEHTASQSHGQEQFSPKFSRAWVVICRRGPKAMLYMATIIESGKAGEVTIRNRR
jgi:hypothetical protein